MVSVCWFDLVKRSNWGFPGIFQRTHERNGPKFCKLMFHDQLQNWLYLDHDVLISSFWHLFDIVNWSNFRHFLENTREEWPAIWHVDISDHLQNGFNFGHSLFCFQAFFGECMGVMAWKLACWCILATFKPYFRRFVSTAEYSYNFSGDFDLWRWFIEWQPWLRWHRPKEWPCEPF